MKIININEYYKINIFIKTINKLNNNKIFNNINYTFDLLGRSYLNFNYEYIKN
jgi:hypothetical protein